MRELTILSVLGAALAACHGAAPAPAPPAPLASAVGLHRVAAIDPVGGGPLPVAAFYPATGPDGATTELDAYAIAAGRDLPPRDGRHPLIAISHGHAGSMWGHHDLAAALARRGYAVVVLEHAGDNHRDQRGSFTARVMVGRARQVTAAIDAVLADPALRDRIDPARIGVAGFSAGGWTSLLVAGARPDFARLTAYCAAHRDQPLCQAPFDLDGAPASARDPRVRAAFVMAPFALPFGRDGLAEARVPVFLAYAAADELLVPADNAEAIAPLLPALRGVRKLDGAGHYVFLAPCGPKLAAIIPPLCQDPPGIDRAEVHRRLAADALAFFDAELRSSSS